jgi:hypothetical protein
MVVGAVLQLGSCLDLTDLRCIELLATSFAKLESSYREKNLVLPPGLADFVYASE